VLEFCGPKDPVEFISLLLRALQKQEGDEQWGKALDVWTQGRFSQPDPSCQEDSRAESTIPNRVRLTQFLTASSSSRDWIRYHSFFASIHSESVLGRVEAQARFLGCDQRATDLTGYDAVVYRIDAANIAVRLHQSHFGLLSVSETAAVTNPCTSLRLHQDSRRCNRVRCSVLNQGQRC
jgi:hypothetical protein